jgi:hypothetical protein
MFSYLLSNKSSKCTFQLYNQTNMYHRDESRRKMLAERRRLMKAKTQEPGATDQEEVVIFAPEDN